MRDFLIGLLLSIVYSLLILPPVSGESPNIKFTMYPLIYKGMIYIPISSKKCIHIHHWVIFFCFLLFHTLLPSILIGFSLGLFIQGLSYDDAFTFVVANPY